MSRLKARIDAYYSKKVETASDPFLKDHVWQPYDHLRETGAIRRASMDLTRALAELRKPYYA